MYIFHIEERAQGHKVEKKEKAEGIHEGETINLYNELYGFIVKFRETVRYLECCSGTLQRIFFIQEPFYG